jgi:hypothetical protein
VAGPSIRCALWYRAMPPTLGLLRAEAAGRLSYRSAELASGGTRCPAELGAGAASFRRDT